MVIMGVLSESDVGFDSGYQEQCRKALSLRGLEWDFLANRVTGKVVRAYYAVRIW
jgi:hypothetical protein